MKTQVKVTMLTQQGTAGNVQHFNADMMVPGPDRVTLYRRNCVNPHAHDADQPFKSELVAVVYCRAGLIAEYVQVQD